MDDVVLINFKNIHLGSCNTIRFSRNDDIKTIKEQWGNEVKCDGKSYHFRMPDNSLLPEHGIVSNIFKGDEFSLGLRVSPIQHVTEGKSTHADILVSEHCDQVSFEEFFVSLQRTDNGVSVSALRAAVKRKLNSDVQLSQRKWKNESGVEIEETVDGFFDDRGEKCSAIKDSEQIERVLKDSDPDLMLHHGHSPVIKYRQMSSLSEPPTGGIDTVDQTLYSSASSSLFPTASSAVESTIGATSEFHISFLGGQGNKRNFPLKIRRTESGVPVRDLRSEVEKKLGFPVQLRQKRGQVNDEEVVLTQIGYVNTTGDVWKIDQVQEMKNVLLKDNDPPLLVHGKSFAVIRASKA